MNPNHGKPSQSQKYSVFGQFLSPSRTDPHFRHTRAPQYLPQTSMYQRPPLKIRGHSTRPFPGQSVGPAPDHRVLHYCVSPRYFHSLALCVVVSITTIRPRVMRTSVPRTVQKRTSSFRWISLNARGLHLRALKLSSALTSIRAVPRMRMFCPLPTPSRSLRPSISISTSNSLHPLPHPPPAQNRTPIL